jgi:hypothetical protein
LTSEGLGEVFNGDSADTCSEKFPLVLMGGRANGQACAEGEQGPPSARAEIQAPLSKFSALELIKYVKIFSSQEDRASSKFCLTTHVSSVLSEEDGIKERSWEGLSREKRFKKRGVTDLSLFKYPTQVPVLLHGLGVKKKKKKLLLEIQL